jgi:hypothetical protein
MWWSCVGSRNLQARLTRAVGAQRARDAKVLQGPACRVGVGGGVHLDAVAARSVNLARQAGTGDGDGNAIRLGPLQAGVATDEGRHDDQGDEAGCSQPFTGGRRPTVVR